MVRLLLAVASSGLVALSMIACGDDGASSTTPIASGASGSCTEPVEACASLCESVCDKLEACGRAAPDCKARCDKAYACPGETPGHDSAICSSQQSTFATQSCDDICKRSWPKNLYPCEADAG